MASFAENFVRQDRLVDSRAMKVHLDVCVGPRGGGMGGGGLVGRGGGGCPIR
jgi:hypothetical protein